MRPVRSTARAMLSAIFVASGAQALTRPEQLEQSAKPVTERAAPTLRMIHPRLPTQTRDLIRLNGAVQVGAGLLLTAGRLRRPAAAALVGSLVPTTLAAHRFWQESDPANRRAAQVHFLKNLGLFGGLLLAVLDTEGRPSLRWRAGHLAKAGQRYRRMAPIASAAIIGRKIPKLARRR